MITETSSLKLNNFPEEMNRNAHREPLITAYGFPADTKYDPDEESIAPVSPSMITSSIPPEYTSDAGNGRNREVEQPRLIRGFMVGDASSGSSPNVLFGPAAHTIALLELQGHIAALVAMAPSTSSNGSRTTSGQPSGKKSKSRLVKKRSIRFTLPTSRDLPFVNRTNTGGAYIGEFGTQSHGRSEYSLPLPMSIPLPASNNTSRIPSQNVVAHQYHSTAALACMRRLAIAHPSPAIRQEWALRADAFEASEYDLALLEGVPLAADDFAGVGSTDPNAQKDARGKKRDNFAVDIGKGLALMVGVPIVLGVGVAASGIATAGLVVYGSGKFLVGFGRALAFGKL